MNGYAPQWRRYQRLNRLGILAVVLNLASVPLAILADRLGFPPGVAQVVFLTFAAVGSLLLLVMVYAISLWRCPRCHQRFSKGRFPAYGFDGCRCVHCSLQLYEC
jgi:hypothetical protein